MEKRIDIEFDNENNFYSLILGNKGLEKTASNQSDEISNFIANHNFNKEKYVYVLINALGADEYYGNNKNGDGFPEYIDGEKTLINDDDKWGYKTFEHFAKLYKHHVNKDPDKSYGDVLLSVYNPRMHRVELVVRMDRSKAPEECEKVESGNVLGTSMGTKVPYDICSICGNKAKTRLQYCYHLKNMMKKTLPDGRRVYAINPRPKFFDISMVFVPADPTSRVLKKIASIESVASEKKQAEIEKEIPAPAPESTSIDDIIDRLIAKKFEKIEKTEPEIPRDTIDGMCNFPLDRILSTMAFSGIVPKENEFQRIILNKIGKPRLADLLERQNVVFNKDSYDRDPDLKIKITIDNIDDSIFNLIRNIIPSRSRWQPYLLGRLSSGIKIASSESDESVADNIMPIMLAVSGLYSLFKDAVPKAVLSGLAGMLGQHPVLAGGVAVANSASAVGNELFKSRKHSLGTTSAEDLLKLGNCLDELLIKKAGTIKKVAADKTARLKSFIRKVIGNKYVRNALISLPLISMGSGLSKVKRNSGGNLNIIEKGLADHPGKIMLISTLAGHKPYNFVKNGSFDPVFNTDKDAVQMIYENGKFLDLATLVKIGSIF